MRLKNIYICVILMLLAAACGRKAEVTEIAIIPQPVFVTQKTGAYLLDSRMRIHCVNLGQNSATARYVAKSLRKMRQHPSFSGKASGNGITFVLNETRNEEIGDEGYLLEVRHDGISISANTEAGLFYGFQSFVQMLPPDISKGRYSKIRIPCCTILDYPRFEWRGGELDVSRHFFNVKQVKRFIDLLAAYKYNKFHWHLTDDHGWRLQIDSLPLLTEVGAWRPDRDTASWLETQPPRPGEEASYGGFYTRSDVAEVVEYARQRHIDVIPEISIPSHCSPLLAAYPQLSCDGGEYKVQCGPYWPQSAVVCAGGDSLMRYIGLILDEVAEMFPYEYVHIGWDDAPIGMWHLCDDCQKVMKKKHLKHESQLQDSLLVQIQHCLAERGKKAIGWDAAARAGKKDVLVMSWQNTEEALRMAQDGFKIIRCPSEYCSLDYYQADPRYEPAAMGNENTLRHTYGYDPVPSGTNSYLAANVMGGQFVIWSEFVPSGEKLDYMVLPRLCAISESLWSAREVRGWHHFRHKMISHRARLLAAGYHPAAGSFKPMVHRFGIGNGSYKAALETEVPNTVIYYTTDGTDPNTGSKVYVDPIIIPAGTRLKTLCVYEGVAREGIYEFVIE